MLRTCVGFVFAAFFALSGIPVAAIAQSNAATASLSTARVSQLNATLSADFKKLHVPGAAVLILRNGVQVYTRGFGYSTLEGSVAVTPSTHFEIGSVTKQFTGAAVLQLRDAGKLSLDDKLSRFVPEYSHAGDVTIRQLLLQVTGIPNFTEVKGFVHLASTQPGGFAAILKLINDKPLNFSPGTKWQYSNTNYEFLGRVIAKASGESYASYMRTNVLDRAGMADTTRIAHEAALPTMATGYTNDDGKVVPAPLLHDAWAGAAGNLVSTVGDVGKWDNAYFSGRIIPLADVAEALRCRSQPVPQAPTPTVGFGIPNSE